MNLEAAKLDTEYEDGTVTKCEPEPDGDGWRVTFDGFWSLWVQDESGKMGAPPLGACLRKFGRGIGYPVRGIGRVVGGELVGLYRYQTKDEAEAARIQHLADEKARKRKEWEDGKEAFAARVKALPEAFRQRIEFFMRRQDWGPDFGGYELFSCEEAVKIAAHVKDAEKIRAFYDDRAEQKRAGISGEHSGNTFGTACSLAGAYLRNPALIPQMHGALCPLVGCQEYGCHATMVAR